MLPTVAIPLTGPSDGVRKVVFLTEPEKARLIEDALNPLGWRLTKERYHELAGLVLEPDLPIPWRKDGP